MKDTNMQDTNVQNADHLDIRMPYSPPQLRVHGDVAQLTKASSTQGKRDNVLSAQLNKS
jgi:hypothetical protein